MLRGQQRAFFGGKPRHKAVSKHISKTLEYTCCIRRAEHYWQRPLFFLTKSGVRLTLCLAHFTNTKKTKLR